jgi:4-alpha-glucanotransferase
MKFVFSINYSTRWGQILYLNGSLKELESVGMVYMKDGFWSLSIDLPERADVFNYSYFVKNPDGSIIREWGKPRRFIRNGLASIFYIYDLWMDRPYNSPFFSSAFTKSFFVPSKAFTEKIVNKHTSALTLTVLAPEILPGQRLVVAGNPSALGGWDIHKAVVMDNSNFPEWKITVSLTGSEAPVEYKFVVVDAETMEVVAWENGENRILYQLPKIGEAVVVNNGVFRGNPTYWRCAGVAIPVFSLRTENSLGIGDFEDLKMMVDWAAKTGQRVVQLLPVNDTTMTHTWMDSYPYNAITIYALHPLYLSLSVFGKLKDKALNQKMLRSRKELNALPEINYEAVSEAKWEIFREAYKEQGSEILQSAAFKKFFGQNKVWLIPYSVFCHFRDLYQTVDFHQWGEYEVYNSLNIMSLCIPGSAVYDDIAIHWFLQFHLHEQLKDASDYARSKGVILKGDIPIGISPHSVEAWTEPHLFNLNAQTGAPPDDFSTTGQNWGFPTYNWTRMRKDNFSWWKSRFAKMADYFDAYRIDHILGFFRIWEIPMDAVQGILGHFSPALPMSKDELLTKGFLLDDERHLKPYIRNDQLLEMFGNAAERVIREFLNKKDSGVYELKPEVNTQRKIEKYFAVNGGETNICVGLYALVADVLFVRDPHQPDKFHPRITAQHTYSFRALSDKEKDIFNHLYNQFFYQRHNYFWSEQAMQKLPDLIASTDMLTCAEDLGMIPACVPYVLNRLQILTLEIQRMPKDAMVPFANTRDYPYLSVCTTSTHDMSTLRGWWEEDGAKRQKYYHDMLGQSGEVPAIACPWICQTILSKHLASNSMLTIIPLQDWLSMDDRMRRSDPNDDRINIPADPHHYWRYRMHLTLGELLAADGLNDKIRSMISESARN